MISSRTGYDFERDEYLSARRAATAIEDTAALLDAQHAGVLTVRGYQMLAQEGLTDHD